MSSQVGFYRYKTLVEDNKQVAFYQNGVSAGISTIKELPFCDDWVQLKYLDLNGHYRFWTFSKFYETNENITPVGFVDKFVTNIRNDNSNSQNIGNKTERTLSLTTKVDSDDLEFFSQIYSSPRILLKVGELLSDSPSDYVEVKIVGGDSIVKRRKQRTGLINLDIALPEHYTQKMI